MKEKKVTVRRRTCRGIQRDRRIESVSRKNRRCLHCRRRKNFCTSHFVRKIVRRTLRKTESRPPGVCEKRASCFIQTAVSEVMSCSMTESDLLSSWRNLQWSAKSEAKEQWSKIVMMSCETAFFIFWKITHDRDQRICWNVISDYIQQVQRTVSCLCSTANRMWTSNEIEKPSKRWTTEDHRSEWIRLLIRIIVDDTRCEEVQSDWMTKRILCDDAFIWLKTASKKIHRRSCVESPCHNIRHIEKPMHWTIYFIKNSKWLKNWKHNIFVWIPVTVKNSEYSSIKIRSSDEYPKPKTMKTVVMLTVALLYF